MDEKLKWLETRVNSSLRPRNEDLKNMLTSDDNRLAFHEFLNNEDIKRLFVFIRPPRQIIASLQPPSELHAKSIFFLKNNAGVKLSKDNLDEEVMFLDCSDNALQQLDLLAREVYLPLMCTDNQQAAEYGISADKMMDVLHRLMAVVETTEGHIEGEITLPLPSIEVLADAANNVNRRGAVLHVLETTVIGWIKQIRNVLRHDPITDLERQAGEFPGPLDEIKLWETRLDKLHSIISQLDSTVAQDILKNLVDANSTYAASFQTVRKDIDEAVRDTENNLCMLSTMASWLQQLHVCLDPIAMLRLFPPLIHTLMLVWQHSTYYHQPDKFQNLLRLLSNEVVHRAEAMVGEDVLREPLESYSKLKEALRVCAAFRGTYLDYREKAEDINERSKQDHAEKIYGLGGSNGRSDLDLKGDELWKDSPWPPRNAPAFSLLNAFMERCNDVLELVQTTRHFRLLADAAEIGGAGTASLDALVREIHHKYSQAMDTFFSYVSNVLAIDGTQTFEKAFFVFRSVVKDLERRLSDVLRMGFHQCPTIGSQLRLLEVFEGISSRELVQCHLKDKDRLLVESFTAELIQVRGMFHNQQKKPPQHKNMPGVVCKLLWVHALKQRIQLPMLKMKKVSPQSLDGDLGWQLRDAYSEAMDDFEKYENRMRSEWQRNITAELTDRLKQPLLIAEEYDEDVEVRPQVVQVNLDPNLLLLLREIHYLSQEPFNLHLPGTARQLLRNTDSRQLSVTATRLDTIVAKYNTVMKSISQYELPLFERSLSKIDLLFEQGLHEYTWRTEESADFIETATALVCVELHRSLDIVQTNCSEIMQLTLGWSRGTLDVFSARDPNRTYDVEDLMDTQLKPSQSYTLEFLNGLQKNLSEEFENAVIPAGNRIHTLLQSSFEAVKMSEASPAWQNYVDYIDAIVLDGLKQACLTSLKSMLNEIVHCNMASEEEMVPILVIRQELIENEVAFRPPLDQSTSYKSVQETIRLWLDAFLARGRLVNMLGGKGCYADYISVDEEVQQLVENIDAIVRENAAECKGLFQIFKDYSFLWLQDVNQTFQEFLRGKMSPNLMRSPSKHVTSPPSQMRAVASARSSSRASSAKSSIESAGLVGTAERTFLTPKQSRDFETNIPSLDEFDTEIDIYKMARDEILSLQDFKDVGWLRVDLRPIKQVLVTYASKWMWTFTKYLSDQVSSMLENLDAFLKRTEPEIESITGEERDTASFMRMMRLFNEVSAQQQEMDAKFAAMHRTVLLVKKYGHSLSDATQQLFDAAPGRWNNLKTKVSLAKQRLGPRIQEESERITKDLATFGERVIQLHNDLEKSEVYNREFSLSNAWTTIDNFMKRLAVLENEAQDLIELQELLEANVVNFNLLPECRQELSSLKQVWETVRLIDEQQAEWKRHRWQKMNTQFLRDETNKQLEVVGGLPEDVFTWDVYMGLHESITTIQACLPLIDDLSNPAMRTRHWKQLVRVTGGAVQIDNDTLKRMTLGELLSLGLQKHVDDVRAIVQRAVKDLGIEQSLKTYEEVWLSKIFELREHVRNKAIENSDKVPQTTDNQQGDTHSEVSHSETMSQQAGTGQRGRATSRVSNQSTATRGRHTSASSLPQSLLAVGEESGPLMLLHNTEPVFEELESHQVALQTMQGSSAAGSFLDEVLKWQKRLQTIEGVLTVWLQAQELWTLLEDVYNSQEVKTALSADANLFALASREFRLLMKATEKNPNVLQCCQRKNILAILEKLHRQFEKCRKSLVHHLEKRRHKFPRFYFLSIQDVLKIVCNGYDLGQVSLYISKVFENVGNLLCEPVDDNDKCIFQVTGVQSALGEKLYFIEPVMCEGPIESWLVHYMSGVRTALQNQMVSAMKKEAPQKRPREIHSAGARRVALPERKMSTNKAASKGGSRTGSRQSMTQTTPIPVNQSDSSESIKKSPGKEGSNSWTLDHVSEVVYLSTQVELCKQMTEAMTAAEEGNKEAIQAALVKLTEMLNATVIMLKGLEDEKEVEARRQKAKTDSEAGHSYKDKEKHSESMSESASQLGTQRSHQPVPSQKGSVMEINQDPPPTIIEEGSQKHDDSASMLEPHTTEPLDTMNLLAIPVTKKTEEVEGEVERDLDPTELKLVLYPCQIQKISSLIALMAHQRDVLESMMREIEAGDGRLTDSLRSKIQMLYLFDEDTKSVTVNTLDTSFDYGFEYLGSAAREVITPLTERVFLGLAQAIHSHSAGLCMAQAGAGRLSTLHEFSRSLGRPFYNFNCTSDMDHLLLSDIFKGLAMTGSWVNFNNINQLTVSVLSILSQHLSALLQALKASQSTVQLSSQDVSLSLDAACFAVIDSAVKVKPYNPENLLLFNSVTSQLPSTLLSQFRCISIVKPDLLPLTEVLLLSQGFLNARELARRTVTLFDMCRDLIGTNVSIVDDTSQLTFHSHDSSLGWSPQTLKYVALESGAILDSIMSRKLALREAGRKTDEDALFDDAEEVIDSARDSENKPTARSHTTEMSKEDTLTDESEALVLALRNNLMPRLLDRDASIFSTLLSDLWPQVSVPLTFGGSRNTPESDKSGSNKESKIASRGPTQTSMKTSSMPQHASFRASVQLNTPVVQMASTVGENFVPDDSTANTDRQSIDNISDAIAIATSNLGLMPGVAFQARVSQLAMLNIVHRTIIVAGPPGCGKSEVIKTFALAERERGKTIDVQSVFTKAYESEGLLGYWEPETREWREGLVPELLGKFCTQSSALNKSSKDVLPLLQLDGQLDASQFELMESILHNEGSVVLANSERMIIPDALRFIWETDSLSSVSPSLLASVGVLCITADDVGWRLPLTSWIERFPEAHRDLVRDLCDTYVESTVQYLMDLTKSAIKAEHNESGPFYSRVVSGQTVGNMVNTFTSLFEAMIPQNIELTDIEIERCFNYACIWGFGGTLEEPAREPFSQWWKKTFEEHIDFPSDGLVFDYMVETENFTFMKWSDITPSYSGTPHDGIPSDAFVHSVNTQQMLHVLGLLSDAGKPVMLVGDNGCGKSSIVNERIRTVCSGEVAEVLALTIQANRFTNARLVYHRLDERLEWKHGKTYVPKGNKRLMCFIDDLNLAQVDKHFNQSAVELVRQHIDDGGFYNQDNHQWRYVKAVTYVTTVNPNTSATVPMLNSRLLRHFAIFNCPYPKLQQLETIYSTLLQTHFLIPEMSGPGSNPPLHHGAGQDEKSLLALRESEASLRATLSLVVKVTLELQTKLRSMFLPTAQRCHYMFSLKDLSTIFRNMCLSLQPGCSQSRLLLLWEHECDFVYGRRMINEVDYNRFRQAFVRAIRKDFSNDDHIQLLTNDDKAIFSNLVEQDSGLVTAGNIFGNMTSGGSLSESDLKTDLYAPVTKAESVKQLMEHGVEEYNKSHPRIKLALYRTVVEQVCRLARVMASPHEVAHSVLVAEGCTARCAVIAQLAAHLCGYTVFKINPSPISSPVDYKMETFKADLVTAYTRAGVKGEKVLFLLEEEEMMEEDYLVLLAEFVMLGSISHLFSLEESTTIINSIRTEVTQAGLAYTREVAWQFFLRQVKKNFRVCFIALSGGPAFQRRCREYPSFTKNVNFLWFPHWSKKLLIEHTLHHLKAVQWLDRIQQENLAHMLATMHIVIRQQDGQERGPGQYSHLTNFTYEKFVEKFISLVQAKYEDINKVHSSSVEVMEQIHRENKLAAKLKKDLEHEKIVLGERKMGTVRILSQIGQDRAITEQQIKIVKAQMDKITTLKKLLPEYQVSHERAVYKTVAIVADTKKIVQNIKMESLSELRGMQKPIIELEDLMAAIIMILKNPQADLTWQKGAKRQMANLERFIEELLMFDENVLPESTLVLVEPYLRKPSFDPESLERKTSNSACASLCKWVKGVCRYHRMMISKVKPLHAKVEHTTQAIDSAEHKMSLLENKRQALEVRLEDLARGFEEATIDKNNQDEKTISMDKMLETAARFRKVLRREQHKHMQIVQSKPQREADLAGPVAMAAAFATYLGPYHYNFRRLMLTIHWPGCLQERGVSLNFDHIHEVEGRIIEFSIGGRKQTADPKYDLSNYDFEAGSEGDEEEESEAELDELQDEKDMTYDEEEEAEENGEKVETKEIEKVDDTGDEEEEEEKAQKEVMEKDEPKGENKTGDEKPLDGLENIPEEEERLVSGTDRSDSMVGPPGIMTSQEYHKYTCALTKLLVGQQTFLTWAKKDFGPRQMENAAIVHASWQRPPLLLDPYDEGTTFIKWFSSKNYHKQPTVLNMDTRTDAHVIMSLEKCIMRGRPVLLENCDAAIDSLIHPVIQHINTANEHDNPNEARMIKYCGRRILCHPEFRLFLVSPKPKPAFSSHIASVANIINFGSSNESIVDDLLNRAFASLRQDLYRERFLVKESIHSHVSSLMEVMNVARERMKTEGKSLILQEKDVDNMSALLQLTAQTALKVKDLKTLNTELDNLKEELFPLARRGTMLLAVLRSLASLQPAYSFPLPFFLRLFDEALGGSFPEEFLQRDVAESVGSDDEDASSSATDHPRQGAASASQIGADSADKYEDDFENTEQKDNDVAEEEVQEAATGRTSEASRDEMPQFDLPDTTHLPTEGVDYSSLSEGALKQTIDQLTALVFQTVQQSLYEEDRLLFATLVCLNIQEEAQMFSEEEMSLLLQGNPGLGMQLSLVDFDCDASPPSWLPQDKWDDILAVSVLPGPLDSLCVGIAQNPDPWSEWYKDPNAELLPLPNAGDMQTAQAGEEAEAEGAMPLPGMSDFHKLLLVRLLRPDRFPAAMANYVNEHFTPLLEEVQLPNLDQLLGRVNAGHTGVLVLLPETASSSSQPCLSSLKMSQQPADIITSLAQTQGVGVDVIQVGEGNDLIITDALEAAERNNSWVLIEQLHLASPAFLKQLRHHLTRMTKLTQGEEKSGSIGPCVWITMQPSASVPSELIQPLYKLAWDSLQALADSSHEAKADPQFTADALTDLLVTAISSIFKAVPSGAWQELEGASAQIKLLVFSLGVVSGMLETRQLLGTRGMTQYYSLGVSVYLQALSTISSIVKSSDAEPDTKMLISLIAQSIYGNRVCSDLDHSYVTSLVAFVMNQALESNDDFINVASVQIPMPPGTLDCSDYGSWFEENAAGQVNTLEALSLYGSVDRESNDASSSKFMNHLEKLYECQNLDIGDINSIPKDRPLQPMDRPPQINMLRLRAILDNIVEKLPPLLELGDVPTAAVAEYDFPYHRPSIVSVATAASALMPESIGFVLLQECLWLNSLLCHIRQNIHSIHQCLLGGDMSIPRELLATVNSLMDELVPTAWTHPNCQPSTHSLSTWQQDLRQRYQQMQGWVRHQMVPIYRGTARGGMAPVSHGRLRSVWLGGLVNPSALFTALRQEKAVISNCLIDDVELACDDVGSLSADEMDDEAGLTLTQLYLQGASWDQEKHILTQASASMSALPDMYVRPVVTSDEAKQASKFSCPVFMNKSRQVSSVHLGLMSSEPAQNWLAAGTVIILDPGVPEDASKKSRVLAPVHLNVTNPDDTSFHTSQASGLEEEEEDELMPVVPTARGLTTDRSEPSTHSQLSYKPMTPLADPLPPGLQMTRERPVAAEGRQREDDAAATQKVESPLPTPRTPSEASDKYSAKDSVTKESNGQFSSKKSLNKSGEKYSSTDSVSKKSYRSQDERYASKESFAKKSIRSEDERYASKESVGKKSVQSSKQSQYSSRNSLAAKSDSSEKSNKSSKKSTPRSLARSDRSRDSRHYSVSEEKKEMGSQRSQRSQRSSLAGAQDVTPRGTDRSQTDSRSTTPVDSHDGLHSVTPESNRSQSVRSKVSGRSQQRPSIDRVSRDNSARSSNSPQGRRDRLTPHDSDSVISDRNTPRDNVGSPHSGPKTPHDKDSPRSASITPRNIDSRSSGRHTPRDKDSPHSQHRGRETPDSLTDAETPRKMHPDV